MASARSAAALLGRVRLRHDARRADDGQRHPRKVAGGTPGVAERQREVRRPAEQTQHVVAGEPRARRAGRVPQELDSLRRRRLQIGSLLEPASCLREAPAEPQLPGQPSSQCRCIRTVIVERGAADERGPGVVDHPVEALTPGVVRLRGGDLGEHRTAPRFVATLDLGELVRRFELFLTVLTDRLQGAVAGRRAAVDDEQAVVDEPGQPVGDGGTAAPGSDHGHGGVDVEPRGEHRHAAQQGLVGGIEQVVAPSDRVPRESGAAQPCGCPR